MTKALLKKQFLELNTFYFVDKRTGKHRSKAGTAGYILLFAFVFFSVGVAFFGMGDALAAVLFPAGMGWLFYALMGLISMVLGVFGSVFNTFAMLYKSKDNELLLSMPIPPGKLLLVRMVGVYAMSLLYSALVWIPTLLQGWLKGDANGKSILFGILLLFVIAIFVTVLTCALGWVVALISGRLKNKSFITVVLTLAFLGVYYFVYFRVSSMLESILIHADRAAELVRSWLYPIYMMSLGAAGEALPFFIFTAITLAMAALCVFILSRSYTRIVTTDKGSKKAVYTEKTVRAGNADRALLRKEAKRFLGSPTYLMNCGIGVILLVLASAALLFSPGKVSGLMAALSEAAPQILTAVPALAVCFVCLGIAMDPVSACSVSIEGKYFWVTQSLPVTAQQILRAKLKLHTLVNLIPAVLCPILLGFLLRTDAVTIVLGILTAAAFAVLTGELGLLLDLNRPNLTWTNETVVVKQSVSVLIALFGGMLLAAVLGLGAVFLMKWMEPNVYLVIAFAVLMGVSRVLYRRLMRHGAEVLEEL